MGHVGYKKLDRKFRSEKTYVLFGGHCFSLIFKKQNLYLHEI